jgi:hypothetical protein
LHGNNPSKLADLLTEQQQQQQQEQIVLDKVRNLSEIQLNEGWQLDRFSFQSREDR